MSEVRIRPFRSGDFEALYRIDQVCFARGIAYGRAELRFYLALHGAECFVAEADEEIAGFVITESDQTEAHVVTLDVLQRFRRRGTGSQLLARAEESFASRGVEWVWLETATTNEAAIAFWQKHGYRQSREILRGYYGRGGDAYQMRKRLAQLMAGNP
ncbi:MAG TPA: N-acetyltransferase [Candidatus Acidoferrales bacterium]|nr:N-acetyltransferase [Candidatus Acidoferrales bacterium]